MAEEAAGTKSRHSAYNITIYIGFARWPSFDVWSKTKVKQSLRVKGVAAYFNRLGGRKISAKVEVSSISRRKVRIAGKRKRGAAIMQNPAFSKTQQTY